MFLILGYTRLWFYCDERAIQKACQSITVIDSPVCRPDSSQPYLISADVRSSQCEPIVSISLLGQNAFVMHSSQCFLWHDIISIIVLLEETGAMALQGQHEEQPADTVYSEGITQ